MHFDARIVESAAVSCSLPKNGSIFTRNVSPSSYAPSAMPMRLFFVGLYAFDTVRSLSFPLETVAAGLLTPFHTYRRSEANDDPVARQPTPPSVSVAPAPKAA